MTSLAATSWTAADEAAIRAADETCGVRLAATVRPLVIA